MLSLRQLLVSILANRSVPRSSQDLSQSLPLHRRGPHTVSKSYPAHQSSPQRGFLSASLTATGILSENIAHYRRPPFLNLFHTHFLSYPLCVWIRYKHLKTIKDKSSTGSILREFTVKQRLIHYNVYAGKGRTRWNL